MGHEKVVPDPTHYQKTTDEDYGNRLDKITNFADLALIVSRDRRLNELIGGAMNAFSDSNIRVELSSGEQNSSGSFDIIDFVERDSVVLRVTHSWDPPKKITRWRTSIDNVYHDRDPETENDAYVQTIDEQNQASGMRCLRDIVKYLEENVIK